MIHARVGWTLSERPTERSGGLPALRPAHRLPPRVASRRRGDHGQGIGRAGGFAENGDVVRVAAELADIVPHPLQRAYDVQGAVIAGIVQGIAGGEAGMAEPAEKAEAVRTASETSGANWVPPPSTM